MTDEQQAAIDRARAFGLLLGACECVAWMLSKDREAMLRRMMDEARGLWEKEEVFRPLVDDTSCNWKNVEGPMTTPSRSR